MSTTTEAERQARREADRERAVAAVEALQSSEGWQTWLRTRSKFHNYSFVGGYPRLSVVDEITRRRLTKVLERLNPEVGRSWLRRSRATNGDEVPPCHRRGGLPCRAYDRSA